MPLKSFDSLPGEARLWSFGCSRPLHGDEERDFLSRIDAFLDQWRAHGQPLDAGRQWQDGRLLLVAVDESTAPPSGCSIDALVHALKAEEARLGARLVDNGALYYRDATGAIASTTRGEFADLASSGAVDGETVVFDFTKIRLDDLREGRWETTASESWHGRAFRFGVAQEG